MANTTIHTQQVITLGWVGFMLLLPHLERRSVRPKVTLSSPSISTAPPLGSIMRNNTIIRVDLPQPASGNVTLLPQQMTQVLTGHSVVQRRQAGMTEHGA